MADPCNPNLDRITHVSKLHTSSHTSMTDGPVSLGIEHDVPFPERPPAKPRARSPGVGRGNGRISNVDSILGAIHRQACREAGVQTNELTVLAPANDPFRCDTAADERDARWFAGQIERFCPGSRRIHLRGLHYKICSAGDVTKPNGRPYLNTDKEWEWLQGASALTRWLKFVQFNQILDERNAQVINRTTAYQPPTSMFEPGDEADLPPRCKLMPSMAAENHGRQPYRIVIVGEKSSLAEELAHVTEQFEAELFLPTGESTITRVAEIAARAAADDRPTVLLYLSDFDPAGNQMAVSVARKLQALRILAFRKLNIRVYPLALTLDQCLRYDLPSAPLKPEERRAERWIAAMGGREFSAGPTNGFLYRFVLPTGLWAIKDPPTGNDTKAYAAWSREFKEMVDLNDAKRKPNGYDNDTGKDDTTNLDGLKSALSIAAWAKMDIPPSEPLLGDIITRGCKMFTVGQRGLGKTMLGMAMAIAMASGKDLMHWKVPKKVCVLYVDGEMQPRLLQERMLDEAKRRGCDVENDNIELYAINKLNIDSFRVRFPGLPPFMPLNTPEGWQFMRAAVNAIKPDVIMFDNVMALMIGDQREETTWAEAIAFTHWLASENIAQVWLDHTGHNVDRQYGSSTKAWPFDTVGVLTPLEKDKRGPPRATEFQLSFEPPSGKARERKESNWDELNTKTIRLFEGRWSSDDVEEEDDDDLKQTAKKEAEAPKPPSMSPTETGFHNALKQAIAKDENPNRQTTTERWLDECIDRGMIPPEPIGEKYLAKERREGGFRIAKSRLAQKGFIRVDCGKNVTDLVPV